MKVLIIIILFAISLSLFIKNKKSKIEFEQKIDYQNNKINKYQKIFNKKFPVGEIEIIKKFKDLFQKSILTDTVIYYHLKYKSNKRFYEIDFLLISSKYVLIVESKQWKGVTYIYDEKFADVFKNTHLNTFGVDENTKIKVFNVKPKESNDSNQTMEISTYTNPIKQIQNYSIGLKNYFDIPYIENLIVFNELDLYQVRYNDMRFENKRINKYTEIITDKYLETFLKNLNAKDSTVDYENIVNYIDNNLQYDFKLNNENYNEIMHKLLI